MRHELSSRDRPLPASAAGVRTARRGLCRLAGTASVDIDPREAPVRPPRRGPRADVAALDRPQRRGNDLVVPRLELYGRLSGAARVTQLSAAAGSGKTVLVRSWIDHAGLASRAACVLLDQDERDEQRFWLSVLHALRRTSAVGPLVRELTAAPDLDGWTIVERLIDDLAGLQERILLVIDDLDELRSDGALRQLECFVKCASPEVKFVFSSRSDPHLGLHRLRIDGDLTEIRTPDLCFTSNEAQALFESAGVQLSDVALKQLLQRTEGWAGGLRLAAMSLATHDDPERFADEFSGSERTVAAYLLAEVLERHPAEVRQLLLCTSVLERVSGPLADHLTGGSGAEGILLALEDANAFVSSLDAGKVVVSIPPPICRPVAARAAADVPGDGGRAAPGRLRLVRAGGLCSRGGPPCTAGARLAARDTPAR